MTLARVDELIHDTYSDPWHTGIVVKNDDPAFPGCVKALVPGRFEVTAAQYDRLPWLFPDTATGVGGRSDSGTFQVPEVGAEIKVRFINDDPYTARYSTATEASAFHGDQLWDDNYPRVSGGIDSGGNFNRTDLHAGTRESFRGGAGDYISQDDEGNTVIRIPKNLVVKIEGRADIQVAETFSLLVAGAMGVQAASLTEHYLGLLSQKVDGNLVSQVASLLLTSDGAITQKGTTFDVDSSGQIGLKGASFGLESAGDLNMKGGAVGLDSSGSMDLKAGGNLNTDGAQHKAQEGLASPGAPVAPAAPTAPDLAPVEAAVTYRDQTNVALQARLDELTAISEAAIEAGSEFNRDLVETGITEVMDASEADHLSPLTTALNTALQAVPEVGSEVGGMALAGRLGGEIRGTLSDLTRLQTLLDGGAGSVQGLINGIQNGVGLVNGIVQTAGGDLLGLDQLGFEELSTINAMVQDNMNRLNQITNVDNLLGSVNSRLQDQLARLTDLQNVPGLSLVIGPLVGQLSGGLAQLSTVSGLASATRAVLSGQLNGQNAMAFIRSNIAQSELVNRAVSVSRQVADLRTKAGEWKTALSTVTGGGGIPLLNGGSITASINGVIGTTEIGGQARTVAARVQGARQQLASLQGAASKIGFG